MKNIGCFFLGLVTAVASAPAGQVVERSIPISDFNKTSYNVAAVIVQSDFDCLSQKQPGIYADVSQRCRMYHWCDFSGRRISFMCPNTTVFNQLIQNCDSPVNVACERSPEYAEISNARLFLGFATRPSDDQYIEDNNLPFTKDLDGTVPRSGEDRFAAIFKRQKRKAHGSTAGTAQENPQVSSVERVRVGGEVSKHSSSSPVLSDIDPPDIFS